MKQSVIKEIVRIGNYEFHLDPPVLKRENEEISLPAKQLETLRLLIERNGEPVSKDEFFRTVWHGDFVEEGNLSQTIFLLRRTLGKLEDGGEYIETIPRVGYRLSHAALAVPAGRHPVQVVPPDHSLAFSTDAVVPHEASALKPWHQQSIQPLPLLIGLLAVGAVAFGFRLNVEHPVVLHSASVTADAQAKADYSRLILDGSQLFFSEVIDNKSYLGDAAIAGSSVTRNPAPSPSAHASGLASGNADMLFASAWEGTPDLSLSSMALHDNSIRSLNGFRVHDAVWSPDGNTLAMASGREIHLLNAKSGELSVIARLPDVPFWLAWSPDGRRLRFTRQQGPARQSLWEIEPSGANLHPLFSGSAQQNRVCCGSWSPDGKYFLYVLDEGFRSSLWIRRDTRAAALLGPLRESELAAGPVNYWRAPLMAADGSVYAIGEYARGETFTLRPGELASFKPLPGTLSADTIVYSHDGRWMAYILYPEGTLWRSRVDGSEKIQLTEPGQTALSPQWSPDDRHITFLASTGGHQQVLRQISREGAEVRTLLDDGRSRDSITFSPQGDRIALSESIQFGVVTAAGQGIQILDLGTGKLQKIDGSDGLWKARWSPDGRYLAALTSNRNQIMLYRFDTRTWSPLLEQPVNDLVWSPDSDSLYFDTTAGAPPALWKLPIASLKPRLVADLAGIRRTGIDGTHLSITHEGDIQMLRDVGISEIYRLTVSLP